MQIRREFHVVNNLKAKMPIGADIIMPKDIKLEPKNKRVKFGEHGNLTAPIRVTPKGKLQVRTVKTSKTITAAPGTVTVVPISRERFFFYH